MKTFSPRKKISPDVGAGTIAGKNLGSWQLLEKDVPVKKGMPKKQVVRQRLTNEERSDLIGMLVRNDERSFAILRFLRKNAWRLSEEDVKDLLMVAGSTRNASLTKAAYKVGEKIANEPSFRLAIRQLAWKAGENGIARRLAPLASAIAGPIALPARMARKTWDALKILDEKRGPVGSGFVFFEACAFCLGAAAIFVLEKVSVLGADSNMLMNAILGGVAGSVIGIMPSVALNALVSNVPGKILATAFAFAAGLACVPTNIVLNLLKLPYDFIAGNGGRER